LLLLTTTIHLENPILATQIFNSVQIEPSPTRVRYPCCRGWKTRF